MGYRLPLACVISLLLSFSAGQDTSNCPEYVPEGRTLDCTCLGRCQSSTDRPVLTWPGHNNTDRLVKTSISRQQDGDQFVCQMVCGSQATNTTYTLRVAYGPEVSTSNVSGPLPFITNGTMVMTLTCNAATNPPPEYTWYDVSCDNSNTHSTCSFTPALGDDGKHVECQVTNPKIIPPKKATVGFNISLHYPPQSKPTITSSRPGEILKAGDTLTCTVTGGKPLVNNVSFVCDNPHHGDREDTRNETAMSVSSSLTINTSQATEHNMTCTCTATWQHGSVQYTQNRVNDTFMTDYPCSINNFTLDKSGNTLTVKETEGVNVTIECEARGRPPPNVSLVRTSADGIVKLTEKDSNTSDESIILTYVVTAVNWTHMGNYTCTADNDVGRTDRISRTLTVYSKPRLQLPDASEGSSHSTPRNMTKAGITIQLRACPVPDKITYIRLKDDSDKTGEEVSADMFTDNTLIYGPGNNLVNCSISPAQDLSEEHFGVYKANIANGFGSAEYYFKISETIKVGEKSPPDNVALVAGLSAAAVFVVVLVIIICTVICRRRSKPKPKVESRERTYHPDQEFEGTENPTFEKGGTGCTDSDSGIGSSRKSSPTEISVSMQCIQPLMRSPLDDLKESSPDRQPERHDTSFKHDNHTYENSIRSGHVPTSASQQAEAQFDHIGNLGNP